MDRILNNPNYSQTLTSFELDKIGKPSSTILA